MTTLALATVPADLSIHVYLNGVCLRRIDWDYDTGTQSIVIDPSVTVVSGDRLECRYSEGP